MFITSRILVLSPLMFFFLFCENVNSQKHGFAPDEEFQLSIPEQEILNYKPPKAKGPPAPGSPESENEIRHYHRAAVETCTPEFAKIPGHTMCMTDKKVTDLGLNGDEIDSIVNYHNELRGSVHPPATDLQKLEWDHRLAAVAQKWAMQCVLAHDEVRNVPEYSDWVGQNVASGYPSWKAAIKAWYDEIEIWKYGVDTTTYLEEGQMVGHFTQIVNNKTSLVGCGYAYCPDTESKAYHVCNYMVGQSSKAFPYTLGERCSACVDHCVEGVCDCQGLVCQFGGKVNLKSCTCECRFPFIGDDCSEIICPPDDQFRCSQYTSASCGQNYYVQGDCPYLCGLCTEEDRQIFKDVVPGTGIKIGEIDFFVSKQGCEFFGKRPTPEKCMTYGKYGSDITRACTRGCDSCKQYSNVATDFCPVMCGLCDEVDPDLLAAVQPGTGRLIHGVNFFKSKHECQLWGPRPTADTCKAYKIKVSIFPTLVKPEQANLDVLNVRLTLTWPKNIVQLCVDFVTVNFCGLCSQ